MLTFPPPIHYLILCDLVMYLQTFLTIYYEHDNVAQDWIPDIWHCINIG